MTGDGLMRALSALTYTLPMYLYHLEHAPARVAAMLEAEALMVAAKETNS